MTSATHQPEDMRVAKQQLRKRMIELRREMPRRARHQAASAALAHLKALPFYQEAEIVMAYMAMPGEMPTRALLQTLLDDGKTLLLPRCQHGRFDPVPVSDLDAQLGDGPMRGLRDPRPDLVSWPVDAPIDLVLAPGLAFDRRGGRLGYGKGMYDYFLSTHQVTKVVAWCLSCQIIDSVPRDAHDVALNGLLCDQGYQEACLGG